ncbi:MAG: ABC transporter permease subunit [Lachnospiraceae bacterium]|nr:ABC transporter permease subunit [Lachnospiraceae bacterium]
MNLGRLELMKIRLSTYLWAILGIFVSLLSLGILFLFIFQIEAGGSGTSEEAELFANWNGLLALTTALAFACFSILAAVIAAKVIISEYCGRNAVILLSYPVNRKAILGTKCLVVSVITTVSAFISNTLVIGIMYISAHIFGIMPQMDTEHFFFTVLFSGFFMGILSSAVGMIATGFGWKKRSVVATIVCSLLIVCVLVNCITISPSNIIWVMLAISVVFVIIANFVYHVLANGIEKMEV